jgi:phenylalanyl-tRNA synthetase beta chain
LCIAGVFGGKNSGVSEHTTSIFLKVLILISEAFVKQPKTPIEYRCSFRFERGIDYYTAYALKRAAF